MPQKKILFLLPYPLHKAPSQRFRVENLLFLLDEAKIEYDLAPFMSESIWKVLYQQGNLIQKAWGISKSYLRRIFLILFRAYRYPYIFVHREAAPLGPPIFEWFLTKVLRKKMIYDFDDAIWIPNTSEQNKIAALVKCFWKVKYICKWSYKISAGNDYLCSFARASGAQQIVQIPTVVNTVSRYNQIKKNHPGQVVVGWTGSHSTLKFLDDIIPVLQDLQSKFDFNFLVIADKKPDLDLKNWTYCPWNEQTEIEDLLKIDIGIMPLKNDAWSEGKCGFKLIQYLSLGIPAIANGVGVNSLIIDNDQNGLIAEGAEAWKAALTKLLMDTQLRTSMGIEGRKKIIAHYSISSQKDYFLSLFE